MYVSSDKLAFVVVAGCQRSGTTLLGQILGAHPSAVLIDEPVAYRVIDKLIEDDLDDTLLAECIEAAASIYRASRDACRPELTHVVLKAPNATFRGSELAKINRFAMSYVFAVRDIRDVVSSMSRLFNIDMVSRQAVWLGRAPDEVKSPLINELVCMNDAGVSVNVRRAAVWLAKTSQYRAFTSPPLSGCLVKYEELVRTPDVVKRALCEHVGLDVEQLPEHSEVMCGSGPGYTVRSRSIDGESIGRWTDSVVADMQDELEELHPERFEVLGEAATLIDNTDINLGETGIGNFVTDLARQAVNAHVFLSTSSSFRAALPPGPI
ncbi:MAG TPA: sulfotransferase, partial [Pirellulaceae bacterium]|nr:sulfotransferase [Pirellulaceae bacterium]